MTYEQLLQWYQRLQQKEAILSSQLKDANAAEVLTVERQLRQISEDCDAVFTMMLTLLEKDRIVSDQNEDVSGQGLVPDV